jgi:hypothetical protein
MTKEIQTLRSRPARGGWLSWAPLLPLCVAMVVPLWAAGKAVDDRTHIYEVMVEGKPRSALSFLPVDHVFKKGLPAAAIIGWMQVSPAAGGEITADNVRVNPLFVAVLQDFIARTAPTDPGFERAARAQGDGWIYVIDRRTPTPMGHVPSEDILGGFEVRGGSLVAGSYQPLKSHRIVSARGMLQLDNFLHPRLVETLKQLPAPAPPKSADQ